MNLIAPERRPSGAGRNALVNFRAGRELIEALRRTAAQEGTSVSELMRRTIVERLGLETEEAPPRVPWDVCT